MTLTLSNRHPGGPKVLQSNRQATTHFATASPLTHPLAGSEPNGARPEMLPALLAVSFHNRIAPSPAPLATRSVPLEQATACSTKHTNNRFEHYQWRAKHTNGCSLKSLLERPVPLGQATACSAKHTHGISPCATSHKGLGLLSMPWSTAHSTKQLWPLR